jgi:hypothetical protein
MLISLSLSFSTMMIRTLFVPGHIRMVFYTIATITILIGSTQIPAQAKFISKWIMYATASNTTSISNSSQYSYYVCTQVWNETNEHMIEWIEHQIFRLGFRNICMISVEQPLNKSLVAQYHIATITKMSTEQEWKYCLQCFTDPPLQPQDMLMIQVVIRQDQFYT